MAEKHRRLLLKTLIASKISIDNFKIINNLKSQLRALANKTHQKILLAN
jgi:hypothetical protein